MATVWSEIRKSKTTKGKDVKKKLAAEKTTDAETGNALSSVLSSAHATGILRRPLSDLHNLFS